MDEVLVRSDRALIITEFFLASPWALIMDFDHLVRSILNALGLLLGMSQFDRIFFSLYSLTWA